MKDISKNELSLDSIWKCLFTFSPATHTALTMVKVKVTALLLSILILVKKAKMGKKIIVWFEISIHKKLVCVQLHWDWIIINGFLIERKSFSFSVFFVWFETEMENRSCMCVSVEWAQVNNMYNIIWTKDISEKYSLFFFRRFNCREIEHKWNFETHAVLHYSFLLKSKTKNNNKKMIKIK